jgi:hypothetical protein
LQGDGLAEAKRVERRAFPPLMARAYAMMARPPRKEALCGEHKAGTANKLRLYRFSELPRLTSVPFGVESGKALGGAAGCNGRAVYQDDFDGRQQEARAPIGSEGPGQIGRNVESPAFAGLLSC